MTSDSNKNSYFDWDEDEDFGGGGTRVLEDPEVDESPEAIDTDDAELYSHWVDSRKAEFSRLTGKPIVALCGKVWVPTKDPDNYPVCPKCKDVYDSLFP